MATTLAEAIDEYAGLANEADAILTSDKPINRAHATVIFQAVELAASALATVQANERRIAYALEALTGALPAEQDVEEVKVSEGVS